MIEVKNLCFGYIKKPLCLVDVSFSVKDGETLIVCGGEGSGKTSLLKILSGLEELYFGSVKIDNIDLKEIKQKRSISYLPSQPVLFENKSVMFNLEFLYKTEQIEPLSSDKLKEIFEKFGLEFEPKKKVKKLPLYQKKILAFIRSYIKNSSILLVDDQFENETSENIEKLKNAILALKECKNGHKTLILVINNKNGLIAADDYLYLSFSKARLLKALNEPIDLYIYDYVLSSKKDYILKNEGSFYLYNLLMSVPKKKRERPQIIYKDKVKLSDKFMPILQKACLEEGEEIFATLAGFGELDIGGLSDAKINNMLETGSLNLYETGSHEKII